MDQMIIRKARTQELRTIQDLNHQLFLFDFGRDPKLNVDWPYQEEGKEYFRRMIAEEIGICFVAEVKGRIVGYLAGCVKLGKNSFRPVKRIELENMFVVEEYRRKGVGTNLVDEFKTWDTLRAWIGFLFQPMLGTRRRLIFIKRWDSGLDHLS